MIRCVSLVAQMAKLPHLLENVIFKAVVVSSNLIGTFRYWNISFHLFR